MAAAIDRGVTICAEKLDSDVIDITLETNGREARVSLKNLRRLEAEPWANYPIGVINIFREAKAADFQSAPELLGTVASSLCGLFVILVPVNASAGGSSISSELNLKENSAFGATRHRRTA